MMFHSPSTPAVFVDYDFGGTQKPTTMYLCLSLCVSGKIVMQGWSPPIDDIMGQDWDFVSGVRTGGGG